jgi:hypothetical protein
LFLREKSSSNCTRNSTNPFGERSLFPCFIGLFWLVVVGSGESRALVPVARPGNSTGWGDWMFGHLLVRAGKPKLNPWDS